MTAFVQHESQSEQSRVVWEIRSVNHRYLEISMRLPEELRSAEMMFRETIKASLSRGRIDAVLRYQSAESSANSPELNLDTINQLMAWSRTVQSTVPVAGELSIADILKWPGVLTPERIDEDQLSVTAKDALANALSALASQRQREGRQLAVVINAKLEAARDIVIGVQGRVPELEQYARQRLNERVSEFAEQLEPGRFEQELVLLLAKSDIVEEIDRLQLHLAEVANILNGSGPVGRRLDFLMQELNREANTLGSKSNHPETTTAAVDLKVLIEQMREQIQNIE
ncbi:MAG: YicC/YloC family endoribonuclease [Pseudomonadota bacterium]|nr:YicC/YloC family endoribonuclease [Pseudomonadota bacterium]MEE3293171.1 YicC/YloC family endoribonuclease [Pseudomonadota bacterium]